MAPVPLVLPMVPPLLMVTVPVKVDVEEPSVNVPVTLLAPVTVSERALLPARWVLNVPAVTVSAPATVTVLALSPAVL